MEFRGNNLLIKSDGKNGRVSLDKGLQVNGSFAFLWKTFTGRDFTPEDVAKALLSEYELSEEEASSAAMDIISLWREYNMIEE